ncbi:hypothetical protein SAMN05216266_12480 [Amycolatopsis marina]|uniref:Uncharacterized protein n=1 Tax=Amycolatopsis marina TaxID=490629 RepID=A0A1I1CB99_9PSEU|nr:hypothetical protein [Amycolatopsis marina]SFB59864.1 hypothetical protein SAMN05216266_12480 [Amycolatopsis marina]
MQDEQYPDFEYDLAEEHFAVERSATAFFAAALAIVGGAWHLGGVVGNALNLVEGRVSVLSLVIGLVLNLVLAAVLICGAVLLLRKRWKGRILVVAGTAAALLLYALTGTLSLAGLAYVGFVGVGLVGGLLALAIVVVPAVITLLLALAPSTARWVEEPDPGPWYPVHGW